MQLTPNPVATWQPTFDRIDELMNERPDAALKLCEQVFVESYLWEPALYVRAAERYGRLMDHLGRAAEARDSLFAAYQAARDACLPLHEAKLLERLARSFYTSGEYGQAKRYWTQCIEMDQTEGDGQTWVLAKVGLAQLSKDGGDRDASMHMLAQALERAAQSNNAHLVAKVKINQAVILLECQQHAAAEPLLQEALAICANHHLPDYLAESNLYLGKIALENGALDRVDGYLDAGLEAARQVGFRWCEAHLLAVQGELYARKGQMRSALDTVRTAQAIARADGFVDMLMHQHHSAAQYAAALNDPETELVERNAACVIEQFLASSAIDPSR
ncbi:MAG: hypothetical protein V4723_20520 [Pseudomonadota bacterium]